MIVIRQRMGAAWIVKNEFVRYKQRLERRIIALMIIAFITSNDCNTCFCSHSVWSLPTADNYHNYDSTNNPETERQLCSRLHSRWILFLFEINFLVHFFVDLSVSWSSPVPFFELPTLYCTDKYIWRKWEQYESLVSVTKWANFESNLEVLQSMLMRICHFSQDRGLKMILQIFWIGVLEWDFGLGKCFCYYEHFQRLDSNASVVFLLLKACSNQLKTWFQSRHC